MSIGTLSPQWDGSTTCPKVVQDNIFPARVPQCAVVADIYTLPKYKLLHTKCIVSTLCTVHTRGFDCALAANLKAWASLLMKRVLKETNAVQS